MDEGPFRMSRPTDRRAASRPTPAPRRPEPTQPEKEQPKVTPQVTPSKATVKRDKKLSSKRPKLPFVVAIIVILLVIGGWFAWSHMKNSATAIDSSKYQAVFFTNGQVYFGKLHNSNGDVMKLTDVYYLQSQQSAKNKTDSENPQATSTDQSNVQLIKLGNEIHGPEDEMVISKDQVLFYENLKTGGKVAQSIAKFKTP